MDALNKLENEVMRRVCVENPSTQPKNACVALTSKVIPNHVLCF